MAVLSVTDTRSYSNGDDISAYSHGCGFDAGKNRVMRFTIQTGANGASEIAWKLEFIYMYSWAYPQIPMRWFIGTDPDSHLNAGADMQEVTGNVTVHMDPVYNSESYMEGSAKVKLKPNTTYYLWIFPAVASQCFYASGYSDPSPSMAVEVSGSGVGGIRILIDGNKVISGVPCVFDGAVWRQGVPGVYDGADWKTGV